MSIGRMISLARPAKRMKGVMIQTMSPPMGRWGGEARGGDARETADVSEQFQAEFGAAIERDRAERGRTGRRCRERIWD